MNPQPMPCPRRVATLVADPAGRPLVEVQTYPGACRRTVRARAAAAGAPRSWRARCGKR
jgi:hypothetical protein